MKNQSKGALVFAFLFVYIWFRGTFPRYRFDQLALMADGGLDSIVAAADTGPGVSATGEEIGDVFGMSVDISF